MPPVDADQHDRLTSTLLTFAALGVAAVVLLQALIGIAPELYWDTDPRVDDSVLALTTLGPRGAVWIAVTELAIAAFAFLAHARVGGTIRYTWLILAVAGGALAAWHLPGPMNDLFRGAQWIGAAAVGLAVAHLATHQSPRRILLAALIAMLLPWAFDAVHYTFFEHPHTLELFKVQQDHLLRARGWEAGSPEHLAFLRRMESSAALGPFALSNVFGTLVAAVTAVPIAFAIQALRHRRPAAVPFAALAGLGMLTVLLTHSKGAIVVALMTLFIAAWHTLAHRQDRSARSNHRLSLLAVTLPLLAIAAIVVRGLVGPPESREGEISLLYRFQYWQAAWDMFAAAGWRTILTGLGPTGFSQQYLIHKNPLNTEQVISAHNLFIDWITMLGVGGLAWTALITRWLWVAGRHTENPPPNAAAAPPAPKSLSLEIDPKAALFALILAVAIFGGQFLVQAPILAHVGPMLLWLAAAAAFVVTLSLLLSTPVLDTSAQVVALPLAATAVVLQSQIDMAFFHQGSVAVCWLIVGLAAARGTAAGQPAAAVHRSTAPLVVAALLLVAALAMAYTVALPVTRHQQHLRRAAMTLRDGDLEATRRELEAASDQLPGDLTAYRWQVSVSLEYAAALSEVGQTNQAATAIHQAFIALDQAFAHGIDSSAYWRLRARLQMFAAEYLREPGRLRSAADAWRNVLDRSPQSLSDHLELADLLWTLGDIQSARPLYKSCLTLSDQAYLDPTRQLNPAQRERIDERLTNPPPRPQLAE